jgi:hypothetical protein
MNTVMSPMHSTAIKQRATESAQIKAISTAGSALVFLEPDVVF